MQNIFKFYYVLVFSGFIVFFLHIPCDFLYAQEISDNTRKKISNAKKIVMIDENNIFILTDTTLYYTKDLGYSYYKKILPKLNENEYYEDLIIKSKNNMYLLTSSKLYYSSNLFDENPCYFTNLNDYCVNIKLPYEIPNLSSEFREVREPWYSIRMINGNIILREDYYHCGTREFLLNEKDKSWILSEGLNGFGCKNEYEFNYDIINKNESYKFTSYYFREGKVDSIFYTRNLGKEWNYICLFNFLSNMTFSKIKFATNKIGLFYNVDNQFLRGYTIGEEFYPTPLSTINLNITTNGGYNWTTKKLNYNNIDYIYFIDSLNWFMICSKINMQGVYDVFEDEDLGKQIYGLVSSDLDPLDYKYYLLKSTNSGYSWSEELYLSHLAERCDNCNINFDRNVGTIKIGNLTFISTDYGNYWSNYNLKLNDYGISNFDNVFMKYDEYIVLGKEHYIIPLDSLKKISSDKTRFKNELEFNRDILNCLKNRTESISEYNKKINYSYKEGENRSYNELREYKIDKILDSSYDKDVGYLAEIKPLLDSINIDKSIYYIAIDSLLTIGKEFITERDLENTSLLADCYNKVGVIDSAIYYYNLSSILDPENIEYYYILSDLYEKINNLESALKCYEKIIYLNKYDYNAKEKYEELFQKVIQQNEGSVYLLFNRAVDLYDKLSKEVKLGPDYVNMENVYLIKDLCEKGLKKKSSFSEYLNNMLKGVNLIIDYKTQIEQKK